MRARGRSSRGLCWPHAAPWSTGHGSTDSPPGSQPMTMMRAVVQTAYGDPQRVLELREVERPTASHGEVVVRVHATSVHADVWHVVTGLPYVLRWMGAGAKRPTPAIPGIDFAGEVHATGPGVREIGVGDRVFGESHRGLQWKNGATFAEFATVPASILAKIPVNVDFATAAAVPTAGYIALANLRGEATVQPGHHVLINGAAGGVGTIALQLVKAQGAAVTAVDRADKLPPLRQLGADHLIDYQREDVTRSASRFDLIFDVASTLRLADCRRILSERGRFVVIGHDHYGSQGRRLLGSIPSMMGLMLRSLFDRHLPKPILDMPPKAEVMRELAARLADGSLTPLVHAKYPLSRVHEAMRALQSGDGVGKILLVP
ncbi:MAG: NAD(P)-dependent alcohol dehydrogenase [Myxococcales bacterium FL481]|nr:MAG: NAD(P)-dependent alcohol dehydrogenase [Myxococcales bacterium FL481]